MQRRIGVCYFKLKDYHSSILELNNPSLSNLPEGLYSESLYLLANSYYRVQQYDDAKKIYLEILNNFPNSNYTRSAQYGLAWTYFQQADYNEAYKEFHSLSDGDDSIAVKSFYWKAEAKRYAGQEDEAFRIYAQFVEKYPNSELVKGVQYQMGVVYYNDKQLDQSERFLKNALTSSDQTRRAKAFTLLGEIELSKKQFSSAKSSFETALDIPGMNPELKMRSLLGYGVSLYYLGNNDDAIERLQEIENDDKHFEPNKVNFYLAESYYANKNYQDAIKR